MQHDGLDRYKELCALAERVPAAQPNTVNVFQHDLCGAWRSVTVQWRDAHGAWLRVIGEGEGINAAVDVVSSSLRLLAGADVQTSVNGSASAETAAHHIADMVRAKLAAQEAHQ